MRFNEAEFQRIQRNAAKAKMNVTEYITASALNRKIIIVDGLDPAIAELKSIGRNLNQLTTLCNMGRIQCLDLNEIKQSMGAIFDTLYALSGWR